jgi:hypothetical protein
MTVDLEQRFLWEVFPNGDEREVPKNEWNVTLRAVAKETGSTTRIAYKMLDELGSVSTPTRLFEYRGASASRTYSAKMPAKVEMSEDVRKRLAECIVFINDQENGNVRRHLALSLQNCLDRLENLAHNGGGHLYLDHAPLSFGWAACGMVGGMILHGSHDHGGNGGAPTYSVCVEGTVGWSLHS